MSSKPCHFCMQDPGLLRHAHVVIENDAWTVKQREIDVLRAENTELRLTLSRSDSDEMRLLRAENERLCETIAEWQEIHGVFTGDVHAACQVEIERLRAALRAHHEHIGVLEHDPTPCSICGVDA